MKNGRLFWMFAIAIAALFFVKSSLAQLPPVGAQIAGNLSIATDYRPYNISLPPGNWQVASLRYEEVNKFHDFTLSQSAGVEAKAFGEIALIQITGGKILGLIVVKARLKTSSKIRTPSICGDQQRHNHLNTYGLRPPQVIKCLQVKPLDWSMTNQSQIFEGIKGYLAKQGINYPVDMVGFQFTEEASRPGRYLEYSYYVNPDIWGYPNTASPVDRSPWVDSAVQRDPNKASFMIALIAYAEAYSSVLSNTARDGGSGAGFVAFNPPANATQRPTGKGQSQSPQSASGPEARLKKMQQTCVSIGFKPGTPGMIDCIKELTSR